MLKFISDPGHGWLGVPFDDLLAVGCHREISKYSYVDVAKRIAWLEEDCDVPRYLRALGFLKHGYHAAVAILDIRTTHTMRASRIRKLPSYSPAMLEVQA